MTRILITLPLLLTLALAPLGPTARGQQLNPSAEAAKVKAEIDRRLNKKEDRVKIKLNNGSEVKGRITQSNENNFTITNEKERRAHRDRLCRRFKGEWQRYDQNHQGAHHRRRRRGRTSHARYRRHKDFRSF